MQEHDMSWVRTEMALAQPAPAGERGLYAWVRKNLIATPSDTILTILGIVIVAWILPQAINWAFINAQWTGPDRSVCATVAQGGIQPDGWTGACWAFVNAKFGQFMFGTYPIEERWRPILVAILALTLNTVAFQAEIFRGGLLAIPPGQLEAARMVGIRKWAARQHILVPQILRLVIPSLVNETISILKNSSLVSVIAVTELMRVSQQIVATTYRSFEIYIAAAIIYIVINFLLSLVGRMAEQRLARRA